MLLAKRITVVLIALATIVVSCWLLLEYRLPGNSQFWRSLQNAGHAILFFIIAFVFCGLLHATRFKRSPFMSAFIALTASMIFGGAVEIVQGFIGREPSWSDMWLDAQGAIAGICVFLVIFARKAPRVVALVLASALVFNSLSLPLRWLIAEQQRARSFPVLADFENRWLSMFVEGRSKAKTKVEPTPKQWQNNPSGRVLKAVFAEGRWPSVIFFELEPDWSGFNEFAFDVYNPQAAPVALSLRIDDQAYSRKYSDRYNATLELRPGHTKIKLPFAEVKALKSGREMDLSRVNQIILFTGRQNQPVTLYFDNFKLN